MLSEIHKLSFLNVRSIVLVIASLYWAKAVLISLALALMLTFLLQPIVAALHQGSQPHDSRRARRHAARARARRRRRDGDHAIFQPGGRAAELSRQPQTQDRRFAECEQRGRAGEIQKTFAELTKQFEHNPPSTAAPQEPIAVHTSGFSLVSYVPSLLGFLADAGLVLVLLLFILIAYDDLRDRLFRLIGYARLTDTTKALDEAGQRISRSLLMQAIVNGTYGCAVGLGLFCFGLPYALLWGLLAAVWRFIPYVGPALVALLPMALSLAVFAGWIKPLLVGVLFVLLELITNMLLEPLLYGRSAGVSQVALLMAFAFWTWLWGPVGLLLATPLTVCLGVLGKYVPHLAFLDILLSDEQVPELNRYYQRLVARDQDGAMEIVEELLETEPLVEVYERVLLPALYYTQQDQQRGNLTAEEAQAIYQATHALIDDLSTAQDTPPANAVLDTSEEDTAVVLPPPVYILGCPVHDEADELALRMLQHGLDPQRFEVKVHKATLLAAEVLSLVGQSTPALVCIGLVPPEALPGRAISVNGCGPGSLPSRSSSGVGVAHKMRQSPSGVCASIASHVGTTLLQTREQIMQVPYTRTPPVSPTVSSMA